MLIADCRRSRKVRRAESVSRRAAGMFRSRKIPTRLGISQDVTSVLSVVAELVIKHVSDCVAKGIMGSHRVCESAQCPSHRMVGYLGEIKTGGMYGPK